MPRTTKAGRLVYSEVMACPEEIEGVVLEEDIGVVSLNVALIRERIGRCFGDEIILRGRPMGVTG